MKAKAKRLKERLDNIRCDVDFKHRCRKQRKDVHGYIASIQIYLDRYEKSAIRPLQFLSSIKTTHVTPKHLTLHNSQMSMTESLNKVAVLESLIKIKCTERGDRSPRNQGKPHIFITTTDSIWEPQCVYWSPSTGDLLVAQYKRESAKNEKVQVVRYNQTGQEKQAIQHKPDLYSKPSYITENNNGDIIVSDYGLSGAVVVTERGGRHRFSYTGHPSGSGLRPRGICTDALSHIIVCDGRTYTVQMINKDGQFLSHILVRPAGILQPYSLNYDVNTHRLWVGSEYNNKICVYRYLARQETISGNLHLFRC
uniref:Tripartite motif-containing protein 3 n=1 Tax=Magallana gigas TaxID=29159 RepID=K1QK09_MAGGI